MMNEIFDLKKTFHSGDISIFLFLANPQNSEIHKYLKFLEQGKPVLKQCSKQQQNHCK